MKKVLILAVLVIGMIASAQTNKETFTEFKRTSKSEKVKLQIDVNNSIDAYITSSGSYYIEKVSKKGKKYRYYLGRYYKKLTFKQYFVFTNKKATKFYYFTIDKKGIHRHKLKKS